MIVTAVLIGIAALLAGSAAIETRRRRRNERDGVSDAGLADAARAAGTTGGNPSLASPDVAAGSWAVLGDSTSSR